MVRFKTAHILFISFCLVVLPVFICEAGDVCCLLKSSKKIKTDEGEQTVYETAATFVDEKECSTGKTIETGGFGGRTVCKKYDDPEKCSSLSAEEICRACGLNWNKEKSICSAGKPKAEPKKKPEKKTAAPVQTTPLK